MTGCQVTFGLLTCSVADAEKHVSGTIGTRRIVKVSLPKVAHRTELMIVLAVFRTLG